MYVCILHIIIYVRIYILNTYSNTFTAFFIKRIARVIWVCVFILSLYALECTATTIHNVSTNTWPYAGNNHSCTHCRYVCMYVRCPVHYQFYLWKYKYIYRICTVQYLILQHINTFCTKIPSPGDSEYICVIFT